MVLLYNEIARSMNKIDQPLLFEFSFPSLGKGKERKRTFIYSHLNLLKHHLIFFNLFFSNHFLFLVIILVPQICNPNGPLPLIWENLAYQWHNNSSCFLGAQNWGTIPSLIFSPLSFPFLPFSFLSLPLTRRERINFNFSQSLHLKKHLNCSRVKGGLLITSSFPFAFYITIIRYAQGNFLHKAVLSLASLHPLTGFK